MSSHHCAAGTATWKTCSSGMGRSPRISISIGSPQSGHVLVTWPSTCRAAGMPKASQAQFPYHERPPASTRCGVRPAELDEAPVDEVADPAVVVVHQPSVPEVTPVGEDHRPARLLDRGDHFVVALGAARLDEGRDAGA